MRTKYRGFSVRIWSWILALTMILTLCQPAFAAEGGLTPTTTDGVAIEDQTDADVDIMDTTVFTTDATGGDNETEPVVGDPITGNVAFTADVAGGDNGIEPRTPARIFNVIYNSYSGYETVPYMESYTVGGLGENITMEYPEPMADGFANKYRFIGWRAEKMTDNSELFAAGEDVSVDLDLVYYANQITDDTEYPPVFEVELYAVYEKLNCVTNDRYCTFNAGWNGIDNYETAVYESDTIVDDVVWSDVTVYNAADGHFEIVRNLIPNETSPRYVYKLADLSTLTQAYLTCHPEYGTSADALQTPLSAIARLGALSGTFVVYPCFATKTVSELNVMSVPGTRENSFFVPYSTIARNGTDMLVCMAKMQYVTDVSSDTPYQSPGITLSVSYPEIQTSSVNDFTSNTTKHNDIAYSWGPVSLASGTPNVTFDPGEYGTTPDPLEYLVSKSDTAAGPSIQPAEGYVFIGWKSSLNEQVFSGDDPWTYADAGLDNGKTLTLSAVYEEAPADIPDVIFDLSGHGSSADALTIQTLENGPDTVITFPAVTDSEPHRYAFSGWHVGIYDAAAGDYVDNGVNVPNEHLSDDQRRAMLFGILLDPNTNKLVKAKFTAVYEKANYVPEGGLSVPAANTDQLDSLDAYAWTDVANMVPIRNLFADANGNYNYKLVNPSSITLGWYADDMTTTPTYYTKTKTEDAVAVKILSENASASGCKFWPVVTESPLATGIPVLPNGYSKFSVLVGSDIAGASMAELSFNGVPGRGPALTWDLPIVSTDAEGKADPNALHSELEQQVVPGQFTGAVKLYYPEIYAYAMQPTLRYGFRILDHDYTVNEDGKIEITMGKGEYVDIEHVIYGDAATLMVAQVKIPYTRQPSFKKAQIYGSTAQDQIDLDTGMNSLNWMNNDVAVTPEGSATFKFRMQTLAAAQPGDYELIHMVPMAVGSDGTSYAIDTHETLIIHVTDKIPVTVMGDGFMWNGDEGGPWKGYDYEGVINPFRPDVFEYRIAYGPSDNEQIVEYDVDSGMFTIPGEDVVDGLEIRVQATPLGKVTFSRYTDNIAMITFYPQCILRCNETVKELQPVTARGVESSSPNITYSRPATVYFGTNKMIYVGWYIGDDAVCGGYVSLVRLSSADEFDLLDATNLMKAINIDLDLEDTEGVLSDGWVENLFYTDHLAPINGNMDGIIDDRKDINRDGRRDLYDVAYILNVARNAPVLLMGIANDDRDVIINCILSDQDCGGTIGMDDFVMWVNDKR